MVSTPTTRGRVEKQGLGENLNTWGDTRLNAAFDRFDEMINGVLAVTISSTSTTLTSANYTSDQARYKALTLTGTLTANSTITVPGVEKLYLIVNNTTQGAYSLTIKTASGTGYALRAGPQWVYCNATDVYRATPRLDQLPAPTASVDFGSQKITGLGTPTLTTDATTKSYVDAAASSVNATGAAASATAAATSATNAANSATAAATSATDAANSATAAAASAASIAGGPVAAVNGSATNLTLTNYRMTHNGRGSVSGAQTISLALGNYASATVTGTVTWTFTNPPTASLAGIFWLELTNAGAFAQTWPVAVKWPSGTAPTLTASGIDILRFTTRDGGATWRGFLEQKDSR